MERCSSHGLARPRRSNVPAIPIHMRSCLDVEGCVDAVDDSSEQTPVAGISGPEPRRAARSGFGDRS